MKEKKAVISIKNLNKSFKVGENNIEVLKDINLEIYFGEFVIIYGQSGCGKSTLLNCITGLEKPTSGIIKIRGNEIYKLTDDQRAKFRHDKFGIIQQQPNWIKALNVLENIEFPLHIGGMNRGRAVKRAKNMADLMGMKKYEGYVPTELSGGQQQKVAMARAFVTNPWIIVADEPTGNLDTISANDVMNIFKYVNNESKRTVIMVTHNLDYEKYASKLVYMQDGKVTKVVDKKDISVGEAEPKDLLEMALEV